MQRLPTGVGDRTLHLVAGRAEEAHDAGETVGTGECDEQGEYGSGDEWNSKQLQSDAGEEEGPEEQPGHDDHCSEVAADQHETDGNAADPEHRDEDVTPLVELVLFLREHHPEPDDQSHLDAFRRLKLHAADGQPVGVAGDRVAERGEDHQGLQKTGDQQGRPGDALPELRRHPAGDEHDRNAEKREAALSEQTAEEPGVFEV